MGLVLHTYNGVRDLSENEHTLTNYGASVGRHMEFDGSSYIDCGNASSLNNLTELTIIAWVYTLDNNQALQSIVCKDDWFSFFAFGLADTGKIRFQKIYSGDNVNSITNNNTMPQDQWVNLVVTYSESGDRKGKIYLNGVLQSLQTDQPSTGTITDDSGDNFYVSEIANPARDFNGLLTDIQIWDEALSADYIKWYYLKTAELRH